MAQATPYTYTERKRIRKSFGKRESVLKVPYLLTMQREAYVAFLQKDLPPSKRKPEGLQAAFLSAFPLLALAHVKRRLGDVVLNELHLDHVVMRHDREGKKTCRRLGASPRACRRRSSPLSLSSRTTSLSR